MSVYVRSASLTRDLRAYWLSGVVERAVEASSLRVVLTVVGLLNPTDPLTKYKAKADEQRHMAFCAGYPELALTMWLQSAAFKTWKPKKIVPLSPLTQDVTYASAVAQGASSDHGF